MTNCCLYGCVTVERADNAITCYCMNSCVRFIFGILVATMQIALYFGVVAIVYFVSFLIVDGIYGPPHTVFYMDFHSDADGVIYGMLLSTVIIGALGLIVGLFAMVFVNRVSPQNQAQSHEHIELRAQHSLLSTESDESDEQ